MFEQFLAFHPHVRFFVDFESLSVESRGLPAKQLLVQGQDLSYIKPLIAKLGWDLLYQDAVGFQVYD